MPVKDFFQKIQPVQLYVVLALTVLFFIVELIVSHLTHALTLLMDSYHMLCNILALSGCIITIKYGSEPPNSGNNDHTTTGSSEESLQETNLQTECQDVKSKKLNQRSKEENKLRNTFGWTRIDVITMLICCVFLASFCFSIYVEALQTLAHIDHQDAMHHPISVLCIGAAGLLLNGLCYLLIGGYTFHQGSFLYVTENGDVVLNKVVVNNSIMQGDKRLSRSRQILATDSRKRQSLWEMTRDVIGSALVIGCSIIVLFIDPEIAKFVDPIISLISSTCIMVLSYPYIKESCMILLQTMPDTINIDAMKIELVNHFPDIVNVHDFHIWQLTATKVISTVHIIFENPKVYKNIMEQIKEFLLERGMTQVTIQPEFFRPSSSIESLTSTKVPPQCLVACQGELCRLNHCCQNYQDLDKNKFKSSKEVLPKDDDAPALKSVKIIDEELHDSKSDLSSSIEKVNEKEKSETVKAVIEEKCTKSTIETSRNEIEECKL